MALLFCLCLAMFLSCALPALAATDPAAAGSSASDAVLPTGSPAFTDLSVSDPLYPDVRYLAGKNIISGFPDGSFRPADSITRAEAAKMMALAKGLTPASGGAQTFSDVPGGHWAYGVIEAAAQNGLFKGYPDGTFNPDGSITRAEAIALLMRLSGGALTDKTVEIADVPAGHWAYQQVATAVQAGLVELSADKSFKPDVIFQRGEMAKSLSALFTLSPVLRPNDLTGKLTVKSGTVKVNGTKVENSVKVGAGDVIATSANSKAEIAFDDGSGFLIMPDTEFTITTAKGFNYMKKDGAAGVAVDKLTVSLKKGNIFGALASRYDNNKTASLNGDNAVLLASLDLPPGILLAEGESAESEAAWWNEPYTQRTRVEVDMPWGVAAIRGTFWHNGVIPNGLNSTALIIGNAIFTAGGRSVSITGGQSSTITSSSGTPTAPVALSQAERQAFADVKDWVTQRAQEIQNNLPPAPTPAVQGAQESSNVVSNVTGALNQATSGVTSSDQTNNSGNGSSSNSSSSNSSESGGSSDSSSGSNMVTATYNDPFTVKAKLLDENAQPLSGKTINFGIQEGDSYVPDTSGIPSIADVVYGTAVTDSTGCAVWTVSNYGNKINAYSYTIGAEFTGDGTNQYNMNTASLYITDMPMSQYSFDIGMQLSTNMAVYGVDTVSVTVNCTNYGTTTPAANAMVYVGIYNYYSSYGPPLASFVLTTDSTGRATGVLPALPKGKYNVTVSTYNNSYYSDWMTHAELQVTGNTRLRFNEPSALYASVGTDSQGHGDEVSADAILEFYSNGAWQPLTGGTVSMEVFYNISYDTSNNICGSSSQTTPITSVSSSGQVSYNLDVGQIANKNPHLYRVFYSYDGKVGGSQIYDQALSIRDLYLGYTYVEQTDTVPVFSSSANQSGGALNFVWKAMTAAGSEPVAGEGISYVISNSGSYEYNSAPVSSGVVTSGADGKFIVPLPIEPAKYHVRLSAAGSVAGCMSPEFKSNNLNSTGHGYYDVIWGGTSLYLYNEDNLVPDNTLKARLAYYTSFSINSSGGYYASTRSGGLAGATVSYYVYASDGNTFLGNLGSAVTDANGYAVMKVTSDLMTQLGLDTSLKTAYKVKAVYTGNTSYAATSNYDFDYKQRRFSNTILKVYKVNLVKGGS
ncbi:MAG: Cellulosome-anchoring protein precursor [Pelotomaculum sp. PtaB.Bin013]|uniref:S-layer homology domain-containing protein n=1 Tax=Pelotomaculum isophthalicicum JI TaxID=947010 RepID=A0A9X4JW73_9FIRM|nr:S-layer homology domain-containing protein [Pelotomaculum isophthalicicum]MDF9409626.1 S-layer homology domain-containing protein [Pelotomaculum isophthalicicum JI]OPX87961.1 MAG: Cellulosome-anchoring protein precursor [Pelotomaculum sp. PtaB.Bin013]